ncbi:hypothetical protein WN943_016135 [Citrus x changshan-huyou]
MLEEVPQTRKHNGILEPTLNIDNKMVNRDVETSSPSRSTLQVETGNVRGSKYLNSDMVEAFVRTRSWMEGP